MEEAQDFDSDVRETSEIDINELDAALRALTLLGDDTYMGMQGMNIAVVDWFIMPLEDQARAYREADEGIDLPAAMFLGAQTQMWLFAVYELLRTWRERAKDMIKWSKTGGFPQKIAALERHQDYEDFASRAFARILRLAHDNPTVIQALRDDLARTHGLFRELEFLRIALAKHQVPGSKRMARAPGYARIDRWTGSLSYELSNGPIILGEVTRRHFAEGMRSWLTDRSVPTPEDLAGIDAFYSFEAVGHAGLEIRLHQLLGNRALLTQNPTPTGSCSYRPLTS